MLAKFIILKNLQKYFTIPMQNYRNLVWKNWADIESRSKNKQMTMSKAQMKSTEAVHTAWNLT